MRILLIRDKDFFIYLHQVSELLTHAGHDVEVLCTYRSTIEPLYETLLRQTQDMGTRCHLVQDKSSWLKRKMIGLAYRFRLLTKYAVITPDKIRQSKFALSHGKPFDYIISFDPPALFLASKLFPGQLSDIIHFSLEVIEETNPDFWSCRISKALRLYERKHLTHIGALMIQDQFRERILKASISQSSKTPTIYYPVAMPGGARFDPPKQIVAWQQNLNNRKVLLFFGGLWSPDLLKELNRVSKFLDDDQVIVVHGGRGSVAELPKSEERFHISTQPISFDEINEVIASCHIGLALYPQSDLNNKYTAFSSEKIARYTQCGIPFIAFDNECYQFLKKKFDCCELIESYDDIPRAARRIFDHYGEYASNARLAFDQLYSLENTSKNLLQFIATKT